MKKGLLSYSSLPQDSETKLGALFRQACFAPMTVHSILTVSAASKPIFAFTKLWAALTSFHQHAERQDTRKVELSFIGQKIQTDLLWLLALCLCLQHFHNDLLLLNKESSLDSGKEAQHHQEMHLINWEHKRRKLQSVLLAPVLHVLCVVLAPY